MKTKTKTKSKPLPKCVHCGQPIRPERKREDYEMDVLRVAFPEARTKADLKRAALRWAYEALLAERMQP